MAGQHLQFYPRTSESDHLAMPRMVDIFLQLFGLHDEPPSQRVFVERVQARMGSAVSEAASARASIAYPSLVRQHHVQVMLRSSAVADNVLWIPWLDYRGIDLLVLDVPFVLGVELSMRSAEADAWRAVKQERHPQLVGITTLRLNVDPACAPMIGPFWVHPPTDVARVTAALRELRASQFRVVPSGELVKLVHQLKANRRLRPKAGLKDLEPVLSAVYAWQSQQVLQEAP
jgi:hypothetical protein